MNERRVRANRANARRSTGPTSASGKARAAQNARRHGLSQDVLADPALGQDVEELAQRIAGDRPDLIDLARRVAEAHVDVQRIRQFRHERLQAAVAAPGHGDQSASTRVCSAEDLAVALAPLTKELKKIDRYARRALSRRKFAVRDFAAAQGRGAGGLKAWAATQSRAKRRRPWRSKFPRCLGETLRWMDDITEECDAVFEDLDHAIARNRARRYYASLASTEKIEDRHAAEKDAPEAPN
jgi:hypothetical protein